ncbi:hypothetical protein F5Y12DRAFT_710603 [Xylaria sp. FL1777]|nr:hypothetical protein F5Y12DRAFT_710603 [Xylaria sp. FL1777]
MMWFVAVAVAVAQLSSVFCTFMAAAWSPVVIDVIAAQLTLLAVLSSRAALPVFGVEYRSADA